jgi:trimeric autotransporter adhesin
MDASLRIFALTLLVGVGCTDDTTTDDSGVAEVDCTPSGVVCTVSGTGSPGNNENESSATLSPLYAPMDVVVWTGADDFFVGDWNNHKIRHVQDGVVETVIGTDFLGDGDPDFAEREAPGIHGTQVAVNHPTSLEWNPVTEKLLVPSWHNHRVREWSPETGFSLVVVANTDISDGNGANAGFAGDGGPAADALMSFPNSIAIDPVDGSFWLLPQSNSRVRWVAHDYSLIETVAGNGSFGYGGDGGDALDASFQFWADGDLQPEPSGALEFDPDTRLLYIADTRNHVIRVLDTEAGTIDTLPGTGTQSFTDEVCSPDALCLPRDVELHDGWLYIADEGNNVIRRYELASGELETVVGTFEEGDGDDGDDALDVSLNSPYGIDVAPDGSLLIADTYNHRIRKVTP